MEKKGNAVNLLTLPFWNSLIIFFNLILVLGRGFCFVSVKSRVKFLKFSKMFKMSACLVFQRPNVTSQAFITSSIMEVSTFPEGADSSHHSSLF